DRLVPARGGADRVRGAGVPGLRVQGVVASLAEGRPDGVDRGEVGDVEAHPGDPVQGTGGGAEGAGGPARARVEVCALGAREELVPRAEQRPSPLDDQGVRAADGDAVAQRTL